MLSLDRECSPGHTDWRYNPQLQLTYLSHLSDSGRVGENRNVCFMSTKPQCPTNWSYSRATAFKELTLADARATRKAVFHEERNPDAQRTLLKRPVMLELDSTGERSKETEGNKSFRLSLRRTKLASYLDSDRHWI